MRPLPRLLAVVDDRVVAEADFPVRAAAIAAAGSAVGLLVRTPSASFDERKAILRRVKALTGPPGAALIGDDPTLGSIAGAHGVLLPAGAPQAPARRLLGPGWIGITARTPNDASLARDEGADWVLAEPADPAIPLDLRTVERMAGCGLPVFAIGDGPLEPIRATGAWGIAVTSPWRASDPAKAIEALLLAWLG